MCELLKVSVQEWTKIWRDESRTSQLSGSFIIGGPSDEVATSAANILSHFRTYGERLHYFVCSGQGGFGVPCYEPIIEDPVLPTLPDAADVLDNAGLVTPEQTGLSPQRAAAELKRDIVANGEGLHMVVIECLTVPLRADCMFIQLLLPFLLQHSIPVVMLIHEHDVHRRDVELADHVLEPLLLLYLCGGRVRQSDWSELVGQSSAKSALAALPVRSRQIEADPLICFADRDVAELVKRRFDRLDHAEQHRLASQLLVKLPCVVGYPLLAIASVTEDWHTMVSRYSPNLVRTTLTDPASLIRYFRRLRRMTQAAGNAHQEQIATLNYIAALLYAHRLNAPRLYQVLCHADVSNIDARIVTRLWFALGQRLVKMKECQTWNYAAEAFQRSRTMLGNIGDLQDDELYSRLAAIANGEALIAVKRRQPINARTLEEAGLAALGGVGRSLSITTQQVLLKTNLGDVLFRIEHNVDAALAEYQIAYDLAQSCQMAHVLQYVLPKLVEALMQVRQYEKAIQILESYLSVYSSAHITAKDMVTLLGFKLTLAQAYVSVNRQRTAAACYWHILRQPEYLLPTTVMGVVKNLCYCRPNIQGLLRARIDRIIVERERITVDLAKAQQALAHMGQCC